MLLCSDAVSSYVYEEARYQEALTHLNVLYRILSLTENLLPSKLAALCLFRVKDSCRKLTAAEFEACTDFRWSDISQLNTISNAVVSG